MASVVDRIPYILEPIAAGLPAEDAAEKQILEGSNHEGFVLRFQDGKVTTAFWDFALSDVYTYAAFVKVTVLWRCVATAGQTRLIVAMQNVQAGSPVDSGYSSQVTMDVTASPTTKALSIVTETPSFSAVAGAHLHIRLRRDVTVHSPQISGDVEVVQVMIEPFIDPIGRAAEAYHLEYDSTPVIDNSRTIFPVPLHTSGTLIAFLSGSKVLKSNIVEIDEVSASILSGGTPYAPTVGESLEWMYIPPNILPDEVFFLEHDSTGDIDGIETEFDIPSYRPGSLIAFYNMVRHYGPNVGEVSANPGKGLIQFGGVPFAPVPGDSLEWLYIPYTP
jgi:hypothetical protein